MRFKCFLSCLALVVANVSAHAQTIAPKVVFLGDGYTAGWMFTNPNWINKGTPGIGFFGLTSSQALAAFDADVVSQHPAIVHIMVGFNDAFVADDASFQFATPAYISNIAAMVTEAKAANIKVILGNIAPSGGNYSFNVQMLNAALAAYAAANKIPLINYYDALCGCVGSTGSFGIGYSYNVPAANSGLSGQNLLLVPGPEQTPPTTVDGVLIPTAAGYALMTQLAQTAIHTLDLTLKYGWLSDVQIPGTDIYTTTAKVNTVNPGNALQFTPIGVYSDGSQQPMLNSSFAGATGTWTSSNPQAMYVSETGRAIALTPGTAIIKYTSPSGVRFSEWIMYVIAF